jgi:hypothetical protein
MDDSIARFSTTDVMGLLNRSRGTIQSLARRHRLGIRVANRRYLFSAEDVARLQQLVSRPPAGPDAAAPATLPRPVVPELGHLTLGGTQDPATAVSDQEFTHRNRPVG